MDNRSKGILFTVLAALVWSTGGLFVKLIAQDAYTILFYRSLFTAIFFLIVLGKSTLRINRKTFITSLFYAPLMLCFVVATKMTTAANAIFIQSTGVAYVLLLEPVIRKTRLSRIDVVTVFCCFIGLALFFIEGFDTPTNALGIIIALCSGLASAGMMISQKTNEAAYVPGGILLGNLWVVLITLPFALQHPIPPTNEMLMLLFLGFIQLGLGFLLFAKGQEFIAAIDSALISLLEPILNPIWVWLGYGEVPGIFPVIGGTIILASIAVRLWHIKPAKTG